MHRFLLRNKILFIAEFIYDIQYVMLGLRQATPYLLYFHRKNFWNMGDWFWTHHFKKLRLYNFISRCHLQWPSIACSLAIFFLRLYYTEELLCCRLSSQHTQVLDVAVFQGSSPVNQVHVWLGKSWWTFVYCICTT